MAHDWCWLPGFYQWRVTDDWWMAIDVKCPLMQKSFASLEIVFNHPWFFKHNSIIIWTRWVPSGRTIKSLEWACVLKPVGQHLNREMANRKNHEIAIRKKVVKLQVEKKTIYGLVFISQKQDQSGLVGPRDELASMLCFQRRTVNWAKVKVTNRSLGN